MKLAIVALCVCLLAASASADPRVSIDKMYRVGDVDKEFFCDECLTFASEALSALLQIILDGGVMGTCSALCSYVPEFEQICDIACDILGIEAFIKLITYLDVTDFIRFCELVKLCPIHDGDAEIISLTFTGDSFDSCDTVLGEAMFRVYNETGPDEMMFEIDGADWNMPASTGNVVASIPPGMYNIELSLDTSQGGGPDGDECWESGDYTVEFQLCQGECGSKHKYSKVFGDVTTPFVLQ